MGYEGYIVLYDVIYIGDYVVFVFFYINSYVFYSRYYVVCVMCRELIMYFEIYIFSLLEVCYVFYY